jgi:hypothetical protein
MTKRYSRIKTLIVLYLHRPLSDNSYYSRAKSLPSNLFLSDSIEQARKEIKGLERQIWRIELLDKYVNKISENNYMVMKYCPIVKIELVSD